MLICDFYTADSQTISRNRGTFRCAVILSQRAACAVVVDGSGKAENNSKVFRFCTKSVAATGFRRPSGARPPSSRSKERVWTLRDPILSNSRSPPVGCATARGSGLPAWGEKAAPFHRGLSAPAYSGRHFVPVIRAFGSVVIEVNTGERCPSNRRPPVAVTAVCGPAKRRSTWPTLPLWPAATSTRRSTAFSDIISCSARAGRSAASGSDSNAATSITRCTESRVSWEKHSPRPSPTPSIRHGTILLHAWPSQWKLSAGSRRERAGANRES